MGGVLGTRIDAGNAVFELDLPEWREYIAVMMTSPTRLTTYLLYKRGFSASLYNARSQKILSLLRGALGALPCLAGPAKTLSKLRDLPPALR